MTTKLSFQALNAKMIAAKNLRKAKQKVKKLGKKKSSTTTFFKTEALESLRLDVVGLHLEWEDTEPLSDKGTTTFPVASSFNKNHTAAQGVIYSFKDPEFRNWLTQQVFNWRIDIEMIFKTPNRANKSHKIEPIYFEERGKMKDDLDNLSGINFRIEKLMMGIMLNNSEIPEGHKNKGIFEKAVYRLTCIGT